jgi:hypothetical protein
MLLLLTAVAGRLLPASIERVLSASDAYDVLQIERGSPTPTKDIEHAHRSIAVEVHPDHHCMARGPVCDAAHRAIVRVSLAREELAREELLRSALPAGSHSAQPAANSDDQAHALWELARMVAWLIFISAAFYLIKLFDSTAGFLKLCWQGRRLAARLSASRWRRWWSYLSSFVRTACAPCAHVLICVPRTRASFLMRALQHRAANRRRARLCALCGSAVAKRALSCGGGTQETLPTRAGRSMARAATRLLRMWPIIDAARSHLSLQASRRKLAALVERCNRRWFKLGFNSLPSSRRRFLLALALVVAGYRNFLWPLPEPSAHTPWSGYNMNLLQQQHEAEAAAHGQMWQGLEELMLLGPEGLELLPSFCPSNCPLLLDDEALQLGVPSSCADELTLKTVSEAEQVARAVNNTARRAVRHAARQAEVAEGAAAHAAATMHALEEANAALRRALRLNVRSLVQK